LNIKFGRKGTSSGCCHDANVSRTPDRVATWYLVPTLGNEGQNYGWTWQNDIWFGKRTRYPTGLIRLLWHWLIINLHSTSQFEALRC
jgi:hypothetical protein